MGMLYDAAFRIRKNSMASLSKLYKTKQINQMRDALIDVHGNKCAICNKPREHFKKNFALDHNHKSNKIRGLLCFRCNKFIVGRQTIETANNLLYYLINYDNPLQESEYWNTIKALLEKK